MSTETTMKTWAVALKGGGINFYEDEQDALDVVDMIRQTETPECTLHHLGEDGRWVIVPVPEDGSPAGQ